MFPEQPAPSQPVVQVQPQQVDVAAPRFASPAALTQSNLAPPESLPPQSSPPASSSQAPLPSAPAATLAPSPEPSPAKLSAPVAPDPVSAPIPSPEAAKAQRLREVEQALLQITSKAHAQKQAQQTEEAAQESAKYGESGDYEKARQAIKKLVLPAQTRAALLRKLSAKQVAKTGKLPAAAIAKNAGTNPSMPGLSQVASVVSPSGVSSGVSSGYTPPPTGYSTQALIPSNQAALQLPIGQLLGKTGLNLILPLTVPTEITSAFGWRTHPITGDARFHRGIDLGAAYGSPVVAAKSGRIYLADMYGGYGLTVIVQHNPMQQTLYAHMSQLFVKPGEWVKQGQLIGQVGSTGASTGPHLHFEFLQQTAQGWSALNPAEVFEQAIAMAQAQNIQRIAKSLGNSLNLSASGVVDISTMAPVSADPLDEEVSGLTESAAINAMGLLLPFTLLPQAALPELGWLSPFVNDFLAAQFDPLVQRPVLSEPPQSVRFQAIAALTLPQTTPIPSATAFKAGNMQVATTKPLANLTIAATMPGIVNLEALPQLGAKQLPAIAPSRSLTKVAPSIAAKQTGSALKTLRLSDNRVNILPSKLPLSVRN